MFWIKVRINPNLQASIGKCLAHPLDGTGYSVPTTPHLLGDVMQDLRLYRLIVGGVIILLLLHPLR